MASEVGFLYLGNGTFMTDRQAMPPIPGAALRQRSMLPGFALTFTCVPPGSGTRIGLDRDGDGFRDGDERDAGSDPADAASVPCGDGRAILLRAFVNEGRFETIFVMATILAYNFDRIGRDEEVGKCMNTGDQLRSILPLRRRRRVR